jgi:hypothetical protein
MTRRVLAVAMILVAVLHRSPAAQDVRQQGKTITFPTFTADQNWTRASSLIHSMGVGGFAFAKSHGASAEEYGRTVGDLFAPGWGQRDGGSAIRYARAIQNNLRAMTGTTVEVLQVSDTLVTMRVTPGWRSTFGTNKQVYGVTLDEYETIQGTFQDQVARYLGLRYAQRNEGEYVVMTISGRGKNAVIEFPRGSYTLALSAQDVPGHPEDVGEWEFTFTPDGQYIVRKNGAPFVHGQYEVQFDELLEQNEQQPNRDPGCNGPGRFRWTVNPATGALSLGRLADDCANRVLVLTRKALTRK